MKRLIMGTLISVITMGNAVAACTYNFDATQNEITAYDSSLLKFPNISGQQTSFNISADTGVKGYIAASSQFLKTSLGDIQTPTTGIFAYEYKIKVPTYLLPGGEGLAFFPLGGLGFSGDSNSLIVFGGYTNNVSSIPGQNVLKIYINDTGKEVISFPITTTSSGYQRLGIYVNQITKQVGLIFNGVNAGYMGTFPNKLDSYTFAHTAAQYAIPTGSPTIGQNISIELITDHAGLQFTYPAGAKDICGNTI